MCSSSASPSSLFLSTGTPILRSRIVPIFSSSSPFINSHRFRNPRLCISSSVSETSFEVTWVSPERNASDDYGGWAVVESPCRKKKKGFRLQFNKPMHSIHEIFVRTKTEAGQSNTVYSNASDVDTNIVEAGTESASNEIDEDVASASKKVKHVLIPVAADSTQQEALLVLKKLKIIEDDVSADELCTKREYARWLVRANLLLERDPRHRIFSSSLPSGSIISAFDDVNAEDRDYGSIQALAEAGIIPSKLSGNSNSALDSSKVQGEVYFSPDRFISRQDLINWKAQLEYKFMPGIKEKILKPDLFTVQISRTKVDFMDMKEISSDASPEFFIDMLAGDRSIVRKVFGQSKRFQPNKPSTKAQSAVALTSGRMTEVIHTELLRLEAEKLSREAEAEEISDLEEERIVHVNCLTENLKEKAAMECQSQLLFRLKDEVDEMSERLACERTGYMAEQRNLQDMLNELQNKQEGVLDVKSILEAEKEALRILRSWVEDEARKNQARAKVLEEVGRRWKWDSDAQMS
ncbi:hypothetical protein CK203_092119 [Vitis vinifera]|uniref:SLH domain-containing protein n=1 Tax=Vitis vinifera TaxID=29760 RepID=A0A438ECK7_VITVI|nr:hypothetical protein CK203_092119 [Vitis vinifera]